MKPGQNKRAKHVLSGIDTVNRSAVCATCGPVKIRPRTNNTRGPHGWRCVTGANRTTKLWKKQKRQIKKDQLGPMCVICGSERDLVWDHCHVAGVFRGTLCRTCNSGLGLFRDNPFLLRLAAEYLDSFNNPSDYV